MPITKLRVQAANVMAKVISAAFKGLCRISFIVPWTLEINIEEEEWEKLCWIKLMLISPGIRKVINGKPKISSLILVPNIIDKIK